ncbi:MAG: hypothetical protein E7480_07940 [Ruminococcaceae bacterium]|nr:hypothetical protein [Oscillospiraceae bacterium]
MKKIHYVIDKYGSVTPEICDGVIENENNVTLLTASFPEELSDYIKTVIFKTEKNILLADGSKTKKVQLVIDDKGIELQSSLINARISEISFKALSKDQVRCFTTKISSFPFLSDSLTADAGAPYPLPSGLVFKSGKNIEINEQKNESIRKICIAMASPLEEKLDITDVKGLSDALENKLDKTGMGEITDNNYSDADKAVVDRVAALEVEDYEPNLLKKAVKYANHATYAMVANSSERSSAAIGYVNIDGKVKTIYEEINKRMTFPSVHNINTQNLSVTFMNNTIYNSSESSPLKSLTINVSYVTVGDTMGIDFTCLDMPSVTVNSSVDVAFVYKGLDCEDGIFSPASGTRYNLTLYYDGVRMIVYVA